MFKHALAAIAAVIVFAATTAFAAACPNITTGNQTFNHSATQLWSPISYNIIAGGDVNLANCPRVPGVGYVVRNPDFSLYYNKNANYELEFRTSGNCDTILLINTGAGNYYYDDDDGDGSNARIRLTRPSAGRYDIWVGTYGPSTCNSRLTMETF
jgi:hypothetical protein